MVYIKVLDEQGNLRQAEALEMPVYVYVQERNGRILRCIPAKAQGILSGDGTVIFQLSGKNALPGTEGNAEVITEAEYLVLSQRREKAEDLDILISALLELPPGQLKKLLTEDVLAVLGKYGYTDE